MKRSRTPFALRLAIVATATLAGTAIAPRLAHAEIARIPSPEEDRVTYFKRPVDAPWRAFELSLGTGYTQGFGMLESGVGMPRVATPGMTLDLGFAWRVNSRWSLGVGAQYQELTAQRANAARGATAGAVVTAHLAPFRTSDPWLSLGSGYRVLWENPPVPSPNIVTQGLELAKLQAGVDFHVTDGVVLGPALGGAVDVFLWQSGTAATTSITEARPSLFVFAGIQGRFEITGDLRPERNTAVARR
jgi:hypothetical protein